MSTKIHHGYRIRPVGHTDVDLLELTGRLRQLLTPLYRAAYAHAVADLATSEFDRRTLNGPSAPGTLVTPVGVAQARLDEAWERTRSGRRDPEFDFGCEVSFLPGPDGRYALLHTERVDYVEAWESLPEVLHYPYWNNTDRPDDVSAQEWAERSQVWADVLPAGRVSVNKLSWSLLGWFLDLSPRRVRDDVAALIPDRAARARTAARSHVQVVECVDGQILLRHLETVRAEIDAEAARIEPLLTDVTVDELYTRP